MNRVRRFAVDERWPGAHRAGQVFLVLLALSAALRLPAFFVPVFNSDEAFLATQAEVLAAGGDLYEEAADRKPPVVPYLYAATFAVTGTTALWSVRVVAMASVALTATMLAVEARRRYGQRAACAAGLLCVFGLTAMAPQDAQAANFEVFMLPSMTAAVLFARRRHAVAAGALVAVATLTKQTGAATLLPVVFLVARGHRAQPAVRAAGAVVAGFTAVLAAAALLVAPSQMLEWTVLGNGSYLSGGMSLALVVLLAAGKTLAWVVPSLPLLWKLPEAWRHRRVPTDDGSDDMDLWLWLLSGAVSVTVGLRFFGHYYLQLVPAAALLAGGALSRASWHATRATLAGGAAVALGFSAVAYVVLPFNETVDHEDVAEHLEANTEEGDRLLVWGSAPEIYWASGRRPATRFVTTNTFLAGIHPGRTPSPDEPIDPDPEMWAYFYEDFRAHPPRYIVDMSPTKLRSADRAPIGRFPVLAEIVRSDYRLARSIDGMDLYVHRNA